MTDLHQINGAPEVPSISSDVERFNGQVDAALQIFRAVAQGQHIAINEQPIAVALAAALLAAEIAGASGAQTGRSLEDVLGLIDSLATDMKGYAEVTFKSQTATAAMAVDPLAAEDVAFREVVANDA